MSLPQSLDFAAVFVFALTGGLAAARAGLDVVGFLFLGCLTAVGGGSVRDLLLDRHPVFWVGDPRYLAVASAAAVAVFVAARHIAKRERALLWLDALAAAVAVAAGVAAARGAGAHPAIVAVMGVVTGCLGGLMRDVVCNELPLVLRHGELYASAALAGALAALGAFAIGAPAAAALVVCAATTFALRAGSLAFGWRLPVYRGDPPRGR